MIGTNHGSGWINYDFIILDLSEAPYWQRILNSGTLSKAHTIIQTDSLCSYNTLTDEMHDDTMRVGLLKSHLKSDGAPKNMQDVVAQAKALESAQKANKLITDATKGIE